MGVREGVSNGLPEGCRNPRRGSSESQTPFGKEKRQWVVPSHQPGFEVEHSIRLEQGNRAFKTESQLGKHGGESEGNSDSSFSENVT